ncbi:ATP-dependent proteinase. Serine peptidase. MEROPS family S16 [Thermoanaerobacter thermohydrosulfuricus]|uniref:Lon protease n=3 Tax=Thermoanaerobacter TaxID=1754 RepID=M8DIM3_THETY|nr:MULTISPECIES: endopeptidase La [Thermoanaerobacter]EMT39927.1 ATP-dependent protease La [Thermoanaerobacter thermohydrosulfuricus WC1]UZQ83636.1 endopeptidase La [Thermoanaerobacter sp. RKWS2]SDF61604.1 ATP-dependent proteinase. Serine peptidase. MEROPS family S16 [Thermoanaerobacter thermohydrosulfuricus]SFE57892.1 ATP-dependent proteinase. Serine peptidase. MEROPS family S16 [Thermoanaerobacter thermohydrosulfuricus]
MTEKKYILPMIPLRGLTIFPYMVLHFDIGREKSIRALEEAFMKNQLIFVTTQKEAEIEDPSIDDVYKVGTITKVKQMLKLPGELIRVLVEGISRAEIQQVTRDDEFFEVEVIEKEEQKEIEKTPELEALMRSVISAFEEYVNMTSRLPIDSLYSVISIEEPGRLADMIAAHISLNTNQSQQLLECFDVNKRLETLLGFLMKELEILNIEREINAKVRSQIDKLQKEYYLREQLKAIKAELGETDEIDQEIEEYEKKINEKDLPEEVRKKAKEELKRLSKMAPGSAEASVVRTYLDWILDLPWNYETEDILDLKRAQKILDEDHYGLKKVKERIIEFLAVRSFYNKIKSPILCLVGPPGVGKTSLGRSIARAMNRKFVRLSLGGVRDEAEIRGHRRTYVGAIPGGIINSIKIAGSKNPVFLLDEIDKMSSDFRGDPASAMLEVLDPEQNSTFRDHYLDLPFDLSKVLFITTANTVDTIPAPLLDRMEVIYVSGYTEEEKLHIAKDYLIPKILKEHGVPDNKIIIQESAIYGIISEYTREAGVRGLEKNLSQIVRKAIKKIVEENAQVVKVGKRNLQSYLGKPIYRPDKANQKDEVGIVFGLAWTRVGGEILTVEASIMPGSGKLNLTGQLGDVMKESAQAGFSYIRANAEKLNIDKDFYKNVDIHIHVPEGAIPKDGPSAGITMVTAMVSALKKVPVKKDVAMTGEITLTGKVLPIGGVKEKVLAAHRAGIRKVILPLENKRDLDEIPQSVKKKLEFKFVEKIDEVLDYALSKEGIYEN